MPTSTSTVRTGLVLGSTFTALIWYPTTLLILTAGPQPSSVHPLHSILSTVALAVGVVLLIATGATAARQARARSIVDGARAGLVAGIAASLPFYVFLMSPGWVIGLGMVPALEVSVLADNPPTREAAVQILQSVTRTALWASPLSILATVGGLALAEALCGAGYVLGSRLGRAVRRSPPV